MVSVTITNQREINEEFGRNVGDDVLTLFSMI